jgi:hypothetical protein
LNGVGRVSIERQAVVVYNDKPPLSRGEKYPFTSRMTSASSETMIDVSPPLPADIVISLAVTAPVDELSVERLGLGAPVGQVVNWFNVVCKTSVTFSVGLCGGRKSADARLDRKGAAASAEITAPSLGSPRKDASASIFQSVIVISPNPLAVDRFLNLQVREGAIACLVKLSPCYCFRDDLYVCGATPW